jgi:uncharacterized protein
LNIDVSRIIKQPGASVSFCERGFVEPLDADVETIQLSGPVTLKGVATSTGEGIYVQANAKGTIRLVCSRCLSMYDHRFAFNCEGRFDKDPISTISDDENAIEVFPLEGDSCSLDEMIRHELMLNLPMKPLCRPDCKGFCPACGTDLNKEDCRCTRPRKEATLFGKKLLEALDERSKEDGSS